jgi:very-short-patch-repair endonuclease
MSCKRNHEVERGGSTGRVAKVATRQGGVVSLEQLEREGISPKVAADRGRARTYHRVHRGVYAVGHQGISRGARLRAALLACGEGAVLSHGTAAAIHRLFDEWPHFVDVTVPVEAGRKIDGIRCRRCRYPEPGEVEARHGLAVTTLARTLVDLAGILDLTALRKVVGRAAVRRKLDLQAIDIALHHAKGRRGLKALELALAPYRTKDGKVPDVRSDFETLLLPQLLELKLSRPSTNTPIRIKSEHFLVDFLWEREQVIVETDGRETHETPTAFQADRRRDQFLAAAGYRVLRVTWSQIHDERQAVLDRISRVLLTGR